MPFESRGEIRYYRFECFTQAVVHGIFTRQGGVSKEPWASLNLGGTVGDEPERVRENRRRTFTALERDPATLFDVWQVHGVDVEIAEAPHPPQSPHARADIILTDRPEVTLMMRFADCVPILLHDPARKVVGLAHAGWLGTVRGVARAAVEAMQTRFGSQPVDLVTAIGPSIGPDHYEVGADVVEQVTSTFGDEAQSLIETRCSSTYFDLWTANRLQLEKSGVSEIEVSGRCTACHTDDWFSHRAEQGKTGRFGAILALPS